MLPDPEALTIRAGNASGFLFQGFLRPLYPTPCLGYLALYMQVLDLKVGILKRDRL